MIDFAAVALAATLLAGCANPGAGSQTANNARAAINADVGRRAR